MSWARVRQAGRRSVAVRWVLVVAVLAAAATVALWPRPSSSEPDADRPPTPANAPDLDTMRATAALAPCPEPAGAGDAAEAAGPLAGVRVPCLGVAGTVDLGAALAGRPTLLNVWSHTCQPCRDELPVLAEYAERDGSVPVLGVQVDGSPEAGLAMLAALGVRLPSVADPDNAFRAAVAAPPVLPLSFLARPDGTVRMVNPPVVFESADQVAGVVAEYLDGAGR